MLLVDAIYVNYGGALNLLLYLVNTLKENKIDFTLLADSRCVGKFDELDHIMYLASGEKNRNNYYHLNYNTFSSVFCFGNVPPPIRLNVPVYTYFHNVNMLTLTDCRDKMQFIKFLLKRLYIKYRQNNTNQWFVQTSNTANELIRHLGCPADKVRLLPFYKLPSFPKPTATKKDYIFVGEYSGSKGHRELLEAWKSLHKKGFDFTLHLTVSLGDEFLRDLQIAISEGVRIVNHGFIPINQLASLYVRCKATIYPSHNESFGLGLVEAMEAGCDVIASDRPYVYAICEPSLVFEPSSSHSIAEAVIKYDKGECRRTKQKVHNQIDDLINCLINE